MNNRQKILVITVAFIVTAVVSYQVFSLVQLYIGDCYPPVTDKGDKYQPAPSEVSALIEEAKRITGESL